jgi:hypothetical protein
MIKYLKQSNNFYQSENKELTDHGNHQRSWRPWNNMKVSNGSQLNE